MAGLVLLAPILGLLVFFSISFIPSVRRFLGRHRIWVALLSPPLIPVYGMLIWELIVRPEGQAFAAIGLAYVAGVVAFALVTALQDRARD